MNLQQILDQFREAKRNNRDLGDRFERLIHRFLELDPLYAERFDKVWMWNDWPDKGNVGDIGVDLVARDRADGEYCAIQCKFYLPEHTLSKGDIDSFFTALGRPLFTSGLIVSTTDVWGRNALDAIEHQTKPVNRLGIADLNQSPIDWSQFDAKRPDALKLLPKKTLRPHQVQALTDVKQGLREADRGKLIMACGTGKTFTALKIAEEITRKSKDGGHVLTYDIEEGVSRYASGHLGGTMNLTGYIDKSDGNTINCYDQASGVCVLGRLIGVDAQYRFMQPFGYINTVNLVGVGDCNNPLYGGPWITGDKITHPDAIFPVRSHFGNHALSYTMAKSTTPVPAPTLEPVPRRSMSAILLTRQRLRKMPSLAM